MASPFALHEALNVYGNPSPPLSPLTDAPTPADISPPMPTPLSPPRPALRRLRAKRLRGSRSGWIGGVGRCGWRRAAARSRARGRW